MSRDFWLSFINNYKLINFNDSHYTYSLERSGRVHSCKNLACCEVKHVITDFFQ